MNKIVHTRAALALALAFAAPFADAQSAAPLADTWQFSLTPYLWLPNINGTLKYQAPPGSDSSPVVDVGPNSYLSALKFAMMINGEARHGNWGLLTDIIYLDFSSQKSQIRSLSGPGGVVQVPFNTSSQADFQGLNWQLGGFYNVVDRPSYNMDVLAGLRYFSVKTSYAWQLSGPLGLFPQSGSVSEKEQLVDAIIGVRGRLRLGEGPWYIPYYLDVGTGSSALTWQALTGIGYTTGWGGVQLSYRQLNYDEGSNKLLQNFRFGGPALSATYKF